MKQQNKTIFISAGEASGDLYGAKLVNQLKISHPELQIFAMGGVNMQAAGAVITVNAKELAIVGIVDVFLNLPKIYAAWRKIKALLLKEKPTLMVLIDYPGFNLHLARLAKTLAIRVLYYISPQIWAWHKNRIKIIKKYVDHMAVILPFEEKIYQNAKIPVSFVGHPLVNFAKPSLAREEALQYFNLSPTAKIIGLMPGSRKSEIHYLLPVLLKAAALIKAKHPDAEFFLPLASTLAIGDLAPYLKGWEITAHDKSRFPCRDSAIFSRRDSAIFSRRDSAIFSRRDRFKTCLYPEATFSRRDRFETCLKNNFRVETGLKPVSTNNFRVETGLKPVSTNNFDVKTGLKPVSTNNFDVKTGLKPVSTNKTVIAKNKLQITITHDKTYDLIHCSDAIIAASGTATLEIALIGTPLIIIYKTAPLNYFIGKRLIKIPFIGLPNLIAQKKIVPELIQNAANPVAIASEIDKILTTKTYREQMLTDLKTVKQNLDIPATSNIFALTLNLLNSQR